MTLRILIVTFLIAVSACLSAQAQGFKFSDEDKADKEAEAKRQGDVQALLATPCRNKIKN